MGHRLFSNSAWALLDFDEAVGRAVVAAAGEGAEFADAAAYEMDVLQT
jgi:hypothetical protein